MRPKSLTCCRSKGIGTWTQVAWTLVIFMGGRVWRSHRAHKEQLAVIRLRGRRASGYGQNDLFEEAMARRLSAAQAKSQLADCLRKAENGESVIITRHGKPVAALVA